jgi:hypothetical protein
VAAAKREIQKLIDEQDRKSEIISERILAEGVDWAQQLVKKDTGALKNSIADSSKVEKIEDCKYNIKLANGLEYGAIQELDPKRGRPHIRPAANVMKIRASGICREVYEG